MRNVALVTTDSLRADRCGAFGYDRPTTPTLSAMDGARFDAAWAPAPYTGASIPSLLTGQLPMRDGSVLLGDRSTLPAFLDGYDTGAVHANVQLPRFDYTRDFDAVFDCSDPHAAPSEGGPDGGDPIPATMRLKDAVWDQLQRSNTAATFAKDLYHRIAPVSIPYGTAATVTDAALSWLDDRDGDRPFFLWIHYMDTHHPYNVTREHFEAVSDRKWDPLRYSRVLERAVTDVRTGYTWSLDDDQRTYLGDAYDACIRRFDAALARVRDALDLDETTLVVSADHGEELWDHGHFGHAGRDTVPRSMTLYEELLHVPLVIAGSSVSDTRVAEPVSLVDLVPTTLDIADREVPTDHELAGRSLRSYWEGDPPRDRAVVAEATEPGDPVDYASMDDERTRRLGAVRRGDWKLVRDGTGPDAETELYDLAADPDERDPVGGETDRRASLVAALDAAIDDSEPGDERLSTDADVEDRLKELGYLG